MRQEALRERIFFLGHLLILGVMLLLQDWSVFTGYIKPDFVLVLLLISALFLDFRYIFLMVLISVFFLSWRPTPNWDLLAFAILPLLVSLSRKFIPGKMEVLGFLTVFLGTIVFYSVSSFSLFWGNFGLAGKIVLLNLIFGFMVFSLVSKFLNPSK